jgi:hypothetical protein
LPLNQGAVEQSAARPAVRLNSVLREAAADCLRPWELPARWWPTEEPPDEARDGAARACWERLPDRLASAPADDLVRAHGVRRVEATCAPREILPAMAGADRKESDLAGETEARAGLESGCPGALPEA